MTYIQVISFFLIMQARGHRVMTVSPRYDQYKDAWDTDVTVDVSWMDLLEFTMMETMTCQDCKLKTAQY